MAGQVFVLQMVVMLLLAGAVATAWVLIARDDDLSEAGERSRAVAEGFANGPGTVAALRSADPSTVLQPRAEATRKQADVDFVIVMNTAGNHYAAAAPNDITKTCFGAIKPASPWHPFIEQVNTRCGRLMQAVVPVTDTDGTVVGLVAAGVPLHGTSGREGRRLPLLFGGFVIAVAVAAVGAALISKRLRRQTRGLDPAELARMYEHLRLLYRASSAIGTTLEVERTAQELARVAVPPFADFVTVDLAEPVVHGDEPTVGREAKLLRVAVGGIREDHPLLPVGRHIGYAPSSPQARAMSSGQAELLPDLQAAWGRSDQNAEAAVILGYGIHSLIAAPLNARGATLGVVTYWRRQGPRPFEHDDLSAASELSFRTAASIDNARHYTREHTMAVTLQRSLLPHSLPEQSAIDAATRYLPAQAGVGGDWFDVIPLSGFRVALVVGDVVGHGLSAAATMGRLRTAVYNFSTLDLPPDELLANLDELVSRIDQTETDIAGETTVTGATCLYAVYDPVSGHCSLARAGHPLPAVVHPDGQVIFPDAPVGPPLGVGGLPFETAELQVPQGSQLILYTDGLVKDRSRDISTGISTLRNTLAVPGRTPEETCQEVLCALRPAHQTDDIALLVARTRRLEPDQVADWDVPTDPAAVAGVRSAAVRKLADWGLEEMAFTTELILSELVTNAIRYATGPIHLRILRDRSLICEVSDTSSTSPHLRYAAHTDEGGRGLFLVAQLADRWGTRYTAAGKVVWSEQALPSSLR
ncbi:SpoIIE family protein phosphatase [Streptomyces sp. x-80]|uniref:SpoIIE family protein phosphatase n=1 Tax=Streptomyces sp. x-80 TaxID=2789282 RepID=UPI003980D65A